MPNFFVPMVQQGQQAPRPGGRRGSGPVQQTQQPIPMMQQQVCYNLQIHPTFYCLSYQLIRYINYCDIFS